MPHSGDMRSTPESIMLFGSPEGTVPEPAEGRKRLVVSLGDLVGSHSGGASVSPSMILPKPPLSQRIPQRPQSASGIPETDKRRWGNVIVQDETSQLVSGLSILNTFEPPYKTPTTRVGSRLGVLSQPLHSLLSHPRSFQHFQSFDYRRLHCAFVLLLL